MHRRRDHSLCGHLLLQILALLAFATHLTSSQIAAPPVAPATATALSPSPSPASSSAAGGAASQCPVSVQYTVNLGQGQDTALVPIFVATITISNNLSNNSNSNSSSTTIQSWRMGWKFPFNSTIKSPQDVFDPTVVLLTPDSVTPVLEETGGSTNKSIAVITNSTVTAGGSGIAPGQSLQFGFLGTKGSGELSASNPYNVGAVTGMVFNNLLCTMISSPQLQQQQQQQQQLAAPDARPGEEITGPTQIEIQYTPIQYRDEPLINTFTQFLARVRNVGNGSTINLPEISLQYWFQGPEAFLPPSVDASPWDYFEARCEWATIGCESVLLGISTGYRDVPGARFALNVSLAENAGTLLPSGDASVPALFLGQQGIDVLDLLLTITTKAGVVLLNSTEDYSFLDTPILVESLQQQQQQQQRLNTTATTIRNGSGVLVPRKAQPNKKIPAYIDGQLAWGILPASPTRSFQLFAPSPETEFQLGRSGTDEVQLPEGVFCESIRGGSQQSCTLQAVYCCIPADPQQPRVSTTIPAVWPPKPAIGGSGGSGLSDGSDEGNNSSNSSSSNSSNSTNGTGSGGFVPGQEESNSAVFFPPLPEPGTSNDSLTGSPQDLNSQQTSGGGGSIAWVAGIAVGIAVGGVVVGGFLVAWRRKRQKRRREAEHEEETKNMMMLNGSSGSGINGSGGGGGIAFVDSESPLSWKKVPPSSPSFLPQNVRAGGSPHYPLLTSAPGAAGHGGHVNGLYKYPSGISGTSSTSADPTAVLDSNFGTFSGENTNTLPYSPFAALGTGMVHSSVTLMPGAIMEGRNEANSRDDNTTDAVGGVNALPSNILALLERKARTCPGSLFSSSTNGTKSSTHPKKKHRNNKKHRRATESPSLHSSSLAGADGEEIETETGGELTGIAALDRFAAANSDSSGSISPPYNEDSQNFSASNRGGSDDGTSDSSSEEESEEGDVFNSNPDIEPWQLRRSTSWDGVLQDPHSSDSFSQVIRLKRRRTAPQQLPAPLPPLSPLPSPLLPSLQGPGPGIDLDVDPSEIMGHLGKCLGTGGFGSVFEAEWRGKKVAVKMLPSTDPNSNSGHGDAAYQALLREIQLASKFDSDRLVKVYGACTRDKNHCCLIMELAENGSLFQRIHDKRKRRLSYLEILQLGHDIACGLAYLHPAVVHRDLKPQNVLLDSEGRAKLADFGISRIKDLTKSYFSQVTAENGTPMYMSPESMNGTRVDEKVDVYALGVILNEAWTRRQPWKDSAHFFQIILKVAINGERPWMDPDCPEPLKRLITKCWHQDPRQRPSCADIMRLTDLLMQDELRKYDEFKKWERV